MFISDERQHGLRLKNRRFVAHVHVHIKIVPPFIVALDLVSFLTLTPFISSCLTIATAVAVILIAESLCKGSGLGNLRYCTSCALRGL